MKRTIATAVATLTLLSVSACGDGNDKKSSDPATSQASQSARTEQGQTEGTAVNEEDLPIVAKGQAYKDSSGVDFRLKASMCGLQSTPTAQRDESQNAVVYKAPAGKELCIATLTITNNGDQPYDSSLRLPTLVAKEKSFRQSADDDEASFSGTFMALAEEINPGDTRELREIFSVPQGTKSTGYLLQPMEVGSRALALLQS